MKRLNKIGVIAFIILSFNSFVVAQQSQITLSGVVGCSMSTMSAMSFVNIYNKNTKKGTVSDTEGKFSILMGKNDTILFSTVQHVEQKYYIKENDFFHDKSVQIDLEQDTVWLDVIAVIGLNQFEQFKQEVLHLDISSNDVSLVLPVVDKYAKEHQTGEGGFEIKGPLTYLSKKILYLGKRKAK